MEGVLGDDVTNLTDLRRATVDHSWVNKVAEADTAEWCYRAIWVGRNQCNYKVHPEVLIENTLAAT